MRPLTDEEILGRLCIHYHHDFSRLKETYLRPDETIFWAGNFSYGDSESSGTIGYFLLTSQRIIQVKFLPEEGFIKGRIRRKVDESLYDFEAPNFPLTEQELVTRKVSSKNLTDLVKINRWDHDVDSWGEHDVLVEIDPGFGKSSRMLFKLADGDELYPLLEEIVQKNTMVEPDTPPNLVDQIEKLKELHRYQVITDDEYHAILARLGIKVPFPPGEKS